MQEKHLFEYAVIRIIPKVEREEFLNIGVILYCAGQQFLQAVYHLDRQKLMAFGSQLDLAELEAYCRSFETICAGGPEGKPISELPIASRFRWLTATRSTMVQTSKVHPGLCEDPGETLLRLHSQLAL